MTSQEEGIGWDTTFPEDDYVAEALEEYDEKLYQEAKREGYCLTITGEAHPEHEDCADEDGCQDSHVRLVQIRAFLAKRRQSVATADAWPN